MHPKKQIDNEYQVIFLPDNGKSRSMEDKSRLKLLRLDTTKQWRGGQVGKVKKRDLRLGFPLSNLHQRDKPVSNLPIHM